MQRQASLYLCFIFLGVTLNADGTVAKKTALGISKQLYAERGFLGLYKGFRPTFLRDVIFSTVYFPLVSYLNDWVRHISLYL